MRWERRKGSALCMCTACAHICVCMYACVHACTYVCRRVHAHTHVCVRMHMCVHDIHTCVWYGLVCNNLHPPLLPSPPSVGVAEGTGVGTAEGTGTACM